MEEDAERRLSGISDTLIFSSRYFHRDKLNRKISVSRVFLRKSIKLRRKKAACHHRSFNFLFFNGMTTVDVGGRSKDDRAILEETQSVVCQRGDRRSADIQRDHVRVQNDKCSPSASFSRA